MSHGGALSTAVTMDHNGHGDGRAAPRGERSRRVLPAFGAIAALVGAAVALAAWPWTSQGPPRVDSEAPVTAMNLVTKPSNNSPVLVADPTDHRFVVLANRLDGPHFGCALQISGDGGRQWRSVAPVPKLPPGADTCYSPEVAFDRRGSLHYLFVALAGTGNSPVGAYLTTSSDRGRTFTQPQRVLGPERYMVRMALDPSFGPRGRLHLVWLEAGTDPPLGGLPATRNPIMAAHSDDGGTTFSAPVQVSDQGRQRVVAPAVAIGRDHRVHVLYYDLVEDVIDYQGLEGPVWEGTWSLVLATSANAGGSFGRGSVVDARLVPPERVMLIFTMPPAALAADMRGSVYVGWYDGRNGDWDVFVRHSSDDGTTWAKPRRVNDDPLRNGRHQYLPRLSVAPGGRLDAVFYDRRGDIENRGNDTYYASSDDQAETFRANTKLSSLGSDSTNGPRYGVPSAQGLNEFGGRLGLLSRRSTVVAAWADTRNTDRGRPSQDIFAATVSVPGRATPSGLRLAGLAAAGGGCLVLMLGLRSQRRAHSAETSLEGLDEESRPPLVPRRLSRAVPAVTAAIGLAAAVVWWEGRGSDDPLLAALPEVDVVMREMRFDHAAVVPRGRVVFRVYNTGRTEHRLVLAPLTADFPPIAEQVSGTERRPISPVGGIPDRPPGAEASFAADLTPGRWAMLCYVVDPDGETHARKGMASEFQVS